MFDPRLRMACLAGALLTSMRVASAEERQSDCPRVAEVTSRLEQLLVSGVDASGAAENIVVRDHGATWEIDVAGHRASYVDPARDCPERVRVATVFAALVLEPPNREAPAQVVGAPVGPASLPRSSMHQGLELAPELVLGLRAGDSVSAWGGGLRWQLSGVRMGLTAGLRGMMPAVVRAGAYEASLARMVFDVSPRVWLRSGSASFTLEMGPFAGLLFARGRNLSPGGSSANLDAGGRAAVRVELTRPRLSPFLAVQGEVSLRRFRFLVEPSGEVGTAPRVWLGLLLGAALGL
jgi:hypothetical protein